MHRFCIIPAAAASVDVHIIFIPPSIFSIFIVQRGIIIMFIAGIIPIPMPMFIPDIGIPMLPRSIVIMLFISLS